MICYIAFRVLMMLLIKGYGTEKLVVVIRKTVLSGMYQA